MKPLELMDTWIKSGKAVMEPARELNELARSALTKLNQQQMAVTKDYVEFGTRGVKALGAVRDTRSFLDQQVALTKELGDKMLANAKSYTNLANDFRAEFAEWAEKTTSAVVAKADAVVHRAA